MAKGAETRVEYASFWERFGALVIDAFLLLPLTLLGLLFAESSRTVLAVVLLLDLPIGVLFHVYLVYKYGGTPGKLLFDIRITMADHSPVTLKAAVLRYAVSFTFSVLETFGFLLALFNMSDAQYFALPFLERFDTLFKRVPILFSWVKPLKSLWIWSELLTMLFNKKRQALHDLIAGTVVVRKS